VNSTLLAELSRVFEADVPETRDPIDRANKIKAARELYEKAQKKRREEIRELLR
jgi:hypothetical protein